MPVTGHDPAALEHQLADRAYDDGLGRGAGVDHDQVGHGSNRRAVGLEPQGAGPSMGRRVQRQLDVLVAAEGAAVGDVHRPFEHVAAPVGAPQVADAVVTAGDVHAGGPQLPDRRHREAVDRRGQDGHAGLGQLGGDAVLGGLVGLAERVGVAHRDPATQPGEPSPFRDELQLPDAERAAVVQMDVDAGAVALGEAEHHVEVPYGVAVDASRIEPADHLDPVLQGRFEQFRRPGVRDQPALREGHLLHGDPPTETLGGRSHGLHAPQPDLGIDVGVGANVGGASGHHAFEQGRDAVDIGEAELATPPTLVGDAIGQGIARRMRYPRPAIERLVEVAVRFDQPWEHEPILDIDHLDPRGVGGPDKTRFHPLDDSVAHQDVDSAVLAPESTSTHQQTRHAWPSPRSDPQDHGDSRRHHRVPAIGHHVPARGGRSPSTPLKAPTPVGRRGALWPVWCATRPSSPSPRTRWLIDLWSWLSRGA